MNDHVTKPIDVPELFKTLCRWLPEEEAKPLSPDLEDNLAISPKEAVAEISEGK
jgi:hypothetical protein